MTRTYPQKYTSQRPFAVDGDEILRAPPAKWEEKRKSSISLAGPDAVSPAEIAKHIDELQQKNTLHI